MVGAILLTLFLAAVALCVLGLLFDEGRPK